jgi:hypothetical protein
MVKMRVNGMDGWMQSRCSLPSNEMSCIKKCPEDFGMRVGMKYKNPSKLRTSNMHLTNNTYDKDESELHGWMQSRWKLSSRECPVVKNALKVLVQELG